MKILDQMVFDGIYQCDYTFRNHILRKHLADFARWDKVTLLMYIIYVECIRPNKLPAWIFMT